jgi:23S rRNA (cytosine1962-C5)-methyltransferase
VIPLPAWQADWVVYEGDALLVVDKPAGVPTQASDDPDVADLGTRLREWLRERDGERTAALGVVHQLDRDASGVVVLSKNRAAARALAAQHERGVARTYLAGLRAAPRPAGGGPELRTLAVRGERALVELRWASRSQPVRRWLAEQGAPIAGDTGGLFAPRLLLHVSAVDIDPRAHTGPMRLRAPEPSTFRAWLDGAAADALPDDTGLLVERLRAARDRRYGITRRGDTDAWRLAHEDGDAVPGVAVDVYGEHAVVWVAEEIAGRERERVLDAVEEALAPAGVYLKVRPRQASRLDAAARLSLAPARAVRGTDAPERLVVRERAVNYEVRLGAGHTTGLFLDQRAARSLVRDLARGASVLNLFGHAGAFTVAAIAGGARRTVTVDSSRTALARADENLRRMGAVDRGAHALCAAEARDWLARARERFDLVVLDPPTFSSARAGRRRATLRVERDYRALAASALGRVAPRGRLLACTNQRDVTAAKLRRWLEEAARDAGRDVAELTRLPDPVDFPAPRGEPCHLKRVLVELAG